jgi:hypothetical protein
MNIRDTEGDGQTAGYCTLYIWNRIAPYVFVYLHVLFCDAYTGTVLQEIQYCTVAAVAADTYIMLLQRNKAGRSQQFNISGNGKFTILVLVCNITAASDIVTTTVTLPTF